MDISSLLLELILYYAMPQFLHAAEGDRMLSMKKVVPVRLLKNKFATTIQTAESAGATADELQL